mmetsp:Transcript_3096/g.6822  ORF Transcript_3096/g.6822 Transcript_3096/m.6822 type:complete len:268 (-) Transcript_3096:281-1084(-)
MGQAAAGPRPAPGQGRAGQGHRGAGRALPRTPAASAPAAHPGEATAGRGAEREAAPRGLVRGGAQARLRRLRAARRARHHRQRPALQAAHGAHARQHAGRRTRARAGAAARAGQQAGRPGEEGRQPADAPDARVAAAAPGDEARAAGRGPALRAAARHGGAGPLLRVHLPQSARALAPRARGGAAAAAHLPRTLLLAHLPGPAPRHQDAFLATLRYPPRRALLRRAWRAAARATTRALPMRSLDQPRHHRAGPHGARPRRAVRQRDE